MLKQVGGGGLPCVTDLQDNPCVRVHIYIYIYMHMVPFWGSP